MPGRKLAISSGCLTGALLIVATSASANPQTPAADTKAAGTIAAAQNPADPAAELRRLQPEHDVWIDSKNKHVVMEGEICLTRGPLEMFACIKGTKEHESVVAVKTKAFVVHAALMALGALPGNTVKYQPKYIPASGPKVEVLVFWTDDKGAQKKARAQDWIRNLKTKKAMEFPWVFAGSGFYFDEATKREYYQAEAGDFICVSNFPSAMLDLPIESTSDDEDRIFEAFTENIPPKGTKVKIVLVPEIKKKAEGDAKGEKAAAK